MISGSLLSAYLNAQRDLGVEEFIFEHGSRVNTLINSNPKNGGGSKTVLNGAERGKNISGNVPSPVSAKSNFQTASSYSRLSKIKPVETFNYVKSPPEPARVSDKKTSAYSVNREKLAAFYREAVNCDKCKLSQNRAKVIFGGGNADGKLFVTGESPLCADDENAGLPFQGEAGELYHKILGKMGLDRSADVFTTYLQKCRGGDESAFNKECALICRSLLDRQIDIIEPEAILIFGESAANTLLNNGNNIEELRSSNHTNQTYRDRPVIVTYSLPLMNKEPRLRIGAWEDLNFLNSLL